MTLKTEQTDVGEQTLITGVCPVTLGEKLTARTSHPMVPKRNPNAVQKSCDIGLFDVKIPTSLIFCQVSVKTEFARLYLCGPKGTDLALWQDAAVIMRC